MKEVGPAGMFLRLWGSAVVCASGACAGVVVFGWLGAPLSSEERADIPWLALSLLGAVGVASAVAGAAVVQRTVPLYRALRRAGDPRSGPEMPPPSAAAVRDAYDAPRWMGGTVGALLLGALLLHASGSVLLPDRFGGRRLFFDLTAGAMLAMVALPATSLWRRALWTWVRPLRPDDVPAGAGGSVITRSVLAVLLPVAGVLLACLAVWTAHAVADPQGARSASGMAMLGAGLLVVVGGAWGASLGVGRLVVRDLDALGRRIGEGLDSTGRPPHRVEQAPTSLRTRAAGELASRVDALAERHARTAEKEARAHRKIVQVRQLKDRFMAYMSHDLRSPLNSVKGFSEILANGTDGPLNEAQRESVEMIHESGEALLQLVNDILDSAKLESGRLELHREWTPSVEILTEAVERARILVGGRSIEIATELEPGLPPVRVDRARIVQAVVGILGHVIAPMQHGTIRLRARVLPRRDRAGRQLRVEVIDEAASLQPEDRDRLFETLRAIREPSGKRMGGLGLGLSLARGLVTAHGGDVWYEAHGDRGTTFSVALDL